MPKKLKFYYNPPGIFIIIIIIIIIITYLLKYLFTYCN